MRKLRLSPYYLNMNENLEGLIPVWNFETHEDVLVEVDSFQMILWKDGLSVFGYCKNGNVLKVITYLFDQEWDVAALETIFENHPIFASNEPFTNIWLAEERNIIIPEHLFEKGYADEWIRKFHHLDLKETLISVHLDPYLKAFFVFPILDEVHTLLKEHFENSKINTLSKLALATPEDTKQTLVKIINLPKLALISFIHEGKFILHQSTSYEKTEDIIYKIALILQEKGISQDQINLSLEGIAPFWNNLIDDLKDFFPLKIGNQESKNLTLDFLNSLYKCE